MSDVKDELDAAAKAKDNPADDSDNGDGEGAVAKENNDRGGDANKVELVGDDGNEDQGEDSAGDGSDDNVGVGDDRGGEDDKDGDEDRAAGGDGNGKPGDVD